MESDPALLTANLVLFTYESKLVLYTRKSNLQKARKFANKFCFIDDFCAMNDSSEFYLPELVLKKEIHQA